MKILVYISFASCGLIISCLFTYLAFPLHNFTEVIKSDLIKINYQPNAVISNETRIPF